METINKSKFVTQKELLKKLNSLNKKLNIVQCHGVFDLLHIGHINYLKESKLMGDLLIVTITSDRFVNKGTFRPYFNQNLRAQSLSALECVDYVCVNDQLNSVNIIKKIRPNYYVKGKDYKNIKINSDKNLFQEKKAVESCGGEIKFTKGQLFSSSSILNRNFTIFNNEQKKFLENLKKNYTFKDIKKNIEELTKLKVLIIGEAIIDEYIFCDTIGKSGKEAILINKKIDAEKYAGGILAVANTISNFSDDVKVLTYLGSKNDNLNFIKKKLQKNISLDFIRKKNSPTILKTRYVDNYSKNKINGIYDINDNILDTKEEIKFIKKISKNISKYDLVLVVDYGHGLLTPNIINVIQKKSKFLAVNSQLNALNSSFHSISKYKKVDYICVHEGELRHDQRNKTDKVEILVKKLNDEIKSKIITITKGSKGSMCFRNNNFTYCPAFANKVIDRVGAGDTLIAISSLCFKSKLSDSVALILSNIAAAKSVESIGTGTFIDKNYLLKSLMYLMK